MLQGLRRHRVSRPKGPGNDPRARTGRRVFASSVDVRRSSRTTQPFSRTGENPQSGSASRKTGVFSRKQACRAKVRRPVVWIAGCRETKILKRSGERRSAPQAMPVWLSGRLRRRGLGLKFHPHMLRHACGFALANERQTGVNLELPPRKIRGRSQRRKILLQRPWGLRIVPTVGGCNDAADR
jgi:hypothetical protein